MKIIQQYICETCGHAYDTEEECLGCEASHVPAQSIFLSTYQKFQSYPKFVHIKMNDGHVLLFRFYDDLGPADEEETPDDPDTPDTPDDPDTPDTPDTTDDSESSGD